MGEELVRKSKLLILVRVSLAEYQLSIAYILWKNLDEGHCHLRHWGSLTRTARRKAAVPRIDVASALEESRLRRYCRKRVRDFCRKARSYRGARRLRPIFSRYRNARLRCWPASGSRERLLRLADTSQVRARRRKPLRLSRSPRRQLWLCGSRRTWRRNCQSSESSCRPKSGPRKPAKALPLAETSTTRRPSSSQTLILHTPHTIYLYTARNAYTTRSIYYSSTNVHTSGSKSNCYRTRISYTNMNYNAILIYY